MKDEKKVSIFAPFPRDFSNESPLEISITIFFASSTSHWSIENYREIVGARKKRKKCDQASKQQFESAIVRLLVILFVPVLTPLLCRTQAVWWMSRFGIQFFSSFHTLVQCYTDTLCFILILGDQVFVMIVCVVAVFFFSPFASKRPRFSSLFFVGYCLFFRRLCIGCLLHLNIVAHNLHVVYCQFYACSLYRRAIAHCSATHNLCVLPVCFGVAEYIQYFFSVVHSLFVAPVMYSQHQSTSSCLISVSVFFLC